MVEHQRPAKFFACEDMKLLEGQGHVLAPAIIGFPGHLRFGVSTAAARVLANGGIRPRSAAIELGSEPQKMAKKKTPSALIKNAQKNALVSVPPSLVHPLDGWETEKVAR